MKRTGKLLSLLLAAAMTAQMGVVMGWGDTASCGFDDHGRTNQTVTDASACTTSNIHWLSSANYTSGAALTGRENGTNYFYVRPNDQVQCAGTSIIIIDPALFTGDTTSIQIMSFSAQDKIYLKGKKASELKEAGDGSSYLLALSSNVLLTITMLDGTSLTDSEIVEYSGSTPRPSLKVYQEKMEKNTSQPLEVNLPAGTAVFAWEKLASDNKTWEPVPDAAAVSYTIPQKDTAQIGDVLKYRCGVLNEIGQAGYATATITVTGCEKTVTLGEIGGVTGGALYSPEEDQEISLSCGFVVSTEGACNSHTGDAHGHTVTWSLSPEGKGIAVSGNTLKLTADSLPESKTSFTLTAKLDGQETEQKAVTFTAQKYVAPVCTAVPKLAITGTASVDETSTGPIKFDIAWVFENEDGCTIEGHKADHHGYQVNSWALNQTQPDYITGFSTSTGEIMFDPAKLPAKGQTLKLTAEVTNNVARSADAADVLTLEKNVTFQRSVTCSAVLQSVSLSADKTSVDFPADSAAAEETVTLTPALTWDQADSCALADSNHGRQLVWSINEEAKPWARIEGQENGTAKLTVTRSGLPSMTNNTVTVTLTVTTAEGAIEKTAAQSMTATRSPRCDKTVTGITIRGDANITVEQGRESIKAYTVENQYSDALCEFGDEHKTTHGETVVWEITSITNNSKMTEGAITIEEGKLVIRGGMLQERNTYAVTIRASVGETKKEATVRVYCAAPSYDDDDDDDDSYIWESYEDKIEDAKRGSTVKLDLTGNAEVPFYVFDSARGKDVTLEMKMGKGYTWTVNGKTLKKLPAGWIYIPMDIQSYTDKKLISLCRDYDVKTFKLRHTGSFYGDMKLTIDVGTGNAKKTMFLYSYDEDTQRLTYQASALADSSGSVTFVMTRSLGAYAVTSKALYGEQPVSSGGGYVGSGSGPTTIYPPVAPVTTPASSASSLPESSDSSSESSSESESEPAPPPAAPSSQEPATPVESETKPQKESVPILVPVLILAIAGVITATVLVVRSGRGKLGDSFDED